jgi:hypothetical protein
MLLANEPMSRPELPIAVEKKELCGMPVWAAAERALFGKVWLEGLDALKTKRSLSR